MTVMQFKPKRTYNDALYEQIVRQSFMMTMVWTWDEGSHKRALKRELAKFRHLHGEPFIARGEYDHLTTDQLSDLVSEYDLKTEDELIWWWYPGDLFASECKRDPAFRDRFHVHMMLFESKRQLGRRMRKMSTTSDQERC